MNKIIQIKGTNGCGKSTTVAQFMDKYNFVRETIFLKKKIDFYSYKDICVLAKLSNKNSPRSNKPIILSDGRRYVGLDGVITDKNLLHEVIFNIIKLKEPRVFIFEALVYGKTYTFSRILNTLAKSMNYEYISVFLTCRNNGFYERVKIRNQGKYFNQSLQKKTNILAARAAKKTMQAGIKTIVVDTSEIEKNNMYKIIEDLI